MRSGEVINEISFSLFLFFFAATAVNSASEYDTDNTPSVAADESNATSRWETEAGVRGVCLRFPWLPLAPKQLQLYIRSLYILRIPVLRDIQGRGGRARTGAPVELLLRRTIIIRRALWRSSENSMLSHLLSALC